MNRMMCLRRKTSFVVEYSEHLQLEDLLIQHQVITKDIEVSLVLQFHRLGH